MGEGFAVPCPGGTTELKAGKGGLVPPDVRSACNYEMKFKTGQEQEQEQEQE